MVPPTTIFDIGMHKGEDTDFYLKKGFRVVGVEAHPALSHLCAERFATACASGQLVIVNQAISTTAGSIDFYINDARSVWGTADREWMLRNEKLGQSSRAVQVPSVRMETLLEAHGTPHYMKVDIEGLDHICIEALIGRREKLKYVSIESHATSYDVTAGHLSLLTDAGYSKFKIVPQHEIQKQVCPQPAREGSYVDHRFPVGSSGLFGAELPGEWMDLTATQAEYQRIYRNVRMIGPHNGLLRHASHRLAQAVLVRLFPGGTGWFDTHASF